MNTYELEVHKIVHLYHRERIKAPSRAKALEVLQSRLDNDALKFIEDDEEIIDAQAYRVVDF